MKKKKVTLILLVILFILFIISFIIPVKSFDIWVNDSDVYEVGHIEHHYKNIYGITIKVTE